MTGPHVLLHGNDRLALAVEQRLAAGGCRVETLAGRGSPFVDFEAATLGRASVLVLAADDDAGNVDLALTARRLRGDLPLVCRVFDDALAAYLRKSLRDVAILSMSAAGAPAFADATVRAIAERSGAPRTAPRRPAARVRVAPFDRVVKTAIVAIATIVIVCTVFFAHALDLSYLDAMYFVWSTVTTVGYGDIALRDAPAAVKIVDMLLMVVGAAFLAVLFGLFTDRVVKRRLDIASGRVRVRRGGHIVLAGGGNVGFRVADRLRGAGHRVVVIERDGDNKNLDALRSSGHQVIVADAARDAILDLANVDAAVAVLCLTESDAVNFQIALLVGARAAGVPVVLRVVSPELSAHVSQHGHAVAISPVAIAAAAFADAALERVRLKPDTTFPIATEMKDCSDDSPARLG